MNNDTICAIATPPGGAIGIVRISGQDAFSAVNSICSLRCDMLPANSIKYARILDGQDIIDECMVAIFCAPHSYTGENCVELYCHGSRYILNKVLEMLVNHACRMARPGEFTQRAFLNGKMDLAQAEAVADLIASTNRATHHVAMNQLRGGISTELHSLRERLLKLTSLIELELDFSDHEDLQFADRTELIQLAQQIEAHITRLITSFKTGNAIKQGIPVAIIGAPNVGKSTLLNQLIGEEKAIVSDIQGTTRDAIEDTIQIEDTTFRFIDTAGIRHTSDLIEQMGIERSLNAAKRAHIIIMMKEPGIPYPDIHTTSEQKIIRIENKTEAFQAKYGIGIENLKKQLLASAPHSDDTNLIITNARHYEALYRAKNDLNRVLVGLNTNLSGDLLSEDLRMVIYDLAEITGGTITSQETLNNIFKNFCVGK